MNCTDTPEELLITHDPVEQCLLISFHSIAVSETTIDYGIKIKREELRRKRAQLKPHSGISL